VDQENYAGEATPCLCMPYFQVNAFQPAKISRVVVRIQGEPLCKEFIRFAVHYKDDDAEWKEVPKVFSFKRKTTPKFQAIIRYGPGHNEAQGRPAIGENEPFQGFYKLEIDPHVVAKHVRVVFSCVEKPDAKSFTVLDDHAFRTDKAVPMTGVFYTMGNGGVERAWPKLKGYKWRGPQGGDMYQQTDNVHRMVRMQLVTQATSFNWDSAAVDALKSMLHAISSPEQVDCTAVNQNAELGRHFDAWITPPRGQWEQDPDVDSEPQTISTDTNQWEVIASKRRNLCGPNCADRVYALEKRLICISEASTTTSAAGNTRVGESPQEANGALASGGMTCCVRKFVEKTVERALDSSEIRQVKAGVRNF